MVAMATTRATLDKITKKRRSVNSSANNSIYRYQAPYNTGNDFVYRDNFAMSQAESDEAEGEISDGDRMTVNQKSGNRYHANWLNMMLPRLRVAKDLLRDDGIILVNIDEHEVTNLQKICVEIFGGENDLGTIIWDKRNPKGDARGISSQHEYILAFSKVKDSFLANCEMVRPKKNAKLILRKSEQLFRKVNSSFTLENANQEFQTWIASQKDLSGGEKAYNRIDENGDVFQSVSMGWPNNKVAPDDYFVALIHPTTNKPCPVPPKGWRNPSSTMRDLLSANLILFGKDETTQPRRKYLLKENMNENIPSLLYYGGSDSEMLSQMKMPFDTPKVVSIVMEHLMSFTKNDDTVLDFFSGSATTAHAVMQLNAEDGGNRQFIMVQVPEVADEKSEAHKAGYKNICEIGKERIRRAGEKIKADVEKSNEQLKDGEEPKQVPDIGFKVFRTADTNIRWTHLALNAKEGFEIDGYNTPMEGKDIIDFMEGYTDIDVVYEILLRQRDIPLSATVEKLDIGNRTYLFADAYVVCLDDTITEELVDGLASIEPTPIKFVLRDSAFDDDIH